MYLISFQFLISAFRLQSFRIQIFKSLLKRYLNNKHIETDRSETIGNVRFRGQWPWVRRDDTATMAHVLKETRASCVKCLSSSLDGPE